MPCPYTSSTPPTPYFVNPPPGLFWLHQCLSHHTRLSTAQCKFFFFIILLLLTPALLSLRATSLSLCHVCSLMPHPLPYATSLPLCHVPSLMLHPFPHAASILSYYVPSLMLCLLSYAMSILLCHIFTPTCAASTPLPLAYPSYIDILTSVRRVGCPCPH